MVERTLRVAYSAGENLPRQTPRPPSTNKVGRGGGPGPGSPSSNPEQGKVCQRASFGRLQAGRLLYTCSNSHRCCSDLRGVCPSRAAGRADGALPRHEWVRKKFPAKPHNLIREQCFRWECALCVTVLMGRRLVNL